MSSIEKKVRDDTAESETVLFAEETEAFALVKSIGQEGVDYDVPLKRLRSIFDKYLECPSLLDSVLEALTKRLAETAQNDLRTDQQDNYRTMRYALSALYALAKVRGRKIIQRFLPHAVDDVEPIWKALQQVLRWQAVKSDEVAPSKGPPIWESIYMLWNWMGVLSLVPFDCDILADKSLVQALMNSGKTSLQEAGPIRDAAATCLASWMSRPDLEAVEIPDFVRWSTDVIEAYSRQRSNVNLFRTLGVLQTCCAALKLSSVSRKRLLFHFQALWDPLLDLSQTIRDDFSLQKLLIKWWSRMSCAHLPPRVATWRYQRGKRSLLNNVRPIASAHDSTLLTSSLAHDEIEKYSIFLVPDEVEDALGRILEGLGHLSTIVRWSAAKGVGRVTERLPELCGEDVLDAVLEFFDDEENDRLWHGGCLALAELARRGLLLPARLGEVIPQVIRAIQFDLQSNHSSVGAHVRDAGCYTYWAFARAYSPEVMKPYLSSLSKAIVLTSLFDREVNCRRAASAAFQEAVGRQGAANFPNGIAILTVADYFSLGNRRHAYTSLAFQIAKMDGYTRPLIRHLQMVKLFHWDITIRKLSAETLGIMSAIDRDYVMLDVLPFLLEKSLDVKNLRIRHGATLGVAESLLGLSKTKAHEGLPEAILVDITLLVDEIEKKRLYRGRGGEIMRSAVCRLIECIAIAKLPLSVQEQVRLLDSIDASIPHPSESIQDNACCALQVLLVSYFPVGVNGPSQRLQRRIVDKFVNIISNETNPAATRGYVKAIGYLPAKLLAPNRSVLAGIIDCLRKAARYDSLVGGESDAESRRNSLQSLSSIASEVGIVDVSRQSENPQVSLGRNLLDTVFDCFFLGLEDYSIDRRGDVGSWSRVASMDAMVELLTKVAAIPNPTLFDQSVPYRVVSSIVKQLSEKIDSVRQKAGDCLTRVMLLSSIAVFVPCRAEIVEALGIEDENDHNWSDASFTFPRVVKLLSLNIEKGEDQRCGALYYTSVLSGLIVSAGGLTESVNKEASFVLIEFAKQCQGTRELEKLATCLMDLFEEHVGKGRFVLPLLKTLEKMLAYRVFDTLLLDPQTSHFATRCMDCLVREERSCRDVPRLLQLTKVIVALLPGVPDAVEHRGVALLCKLTSHPFPRVRSHTAEQFYLVLLENQGFGSSSNPKVLEIILTTPWGSELDNLFLSDKTKEVAEHLAVLRELEDLCTR
jgi:hypothetical protein